MHLAPHLRGQQTQSNRTTPLLLILETRLDHCTAGRGAAGFIPSPLSQPGTCTTQQRPGQVFVTWPSQKSTQETTHLRHGPCPGSSRGDYWSSRSRCRRAGLRRSTARAAGPAAAGPWRPARGSAQASGKAGGWGKLGRGEKQASERSPEAGGQGPLGSSTHSFTRSTGNCRASSVCQAPFSRPRRQW